MTAKLAWEIQKETISEFMEDSVPRLAAALAYYAMFSLGPILVIVIAVAGLFFEKSAVRHEVTSQVQSFMGQKSAETVNSMLNQPHESSVIATVIGVIALLFGASGVFGQLQDALNTIWEVQPKPGQGIWGFIRTRFLSFTMVLGVAFLLLISMVITTSLEAFSGILDRTLGLPELAAKGLHFTVSILVITLLFAMIFKVLPDAEVKWRNVWVGAFGTAVLFTIGKFALGMYLGRQSTISSYGAAGSVIVILLWVYYSSLILFTGAEFTQVYARKTGSRIQPSPHAEPVTERARAEQGIPHDKHPQPEPQPQPADSRAPHLESAPPEPVFVEPDPFEGNPAALPVLASVLGAGFLGGWFAHRELTKASTGNGTVTPNPRANSSAAKGSEGSGRRRTKSKEG